MAEVRADEDELAALIEQGGFWRLVPEWVPREFAVPTRELAERVALGLRRSLDDRQ
ncbi:hypothetical protein [Streptomyces liangshanensis]|uniref:Uncharacterized protein n=1 Tax=Streptomyces liangshanensis TaxID=2717324 RepID=A0A6G9H1K0_9ACTN|nr:hypothetical protein [Streptomyces liangshanensis]QIQ04354.1 hypothetical protein HA039_20435 [Streptomyces liangshanensis]